MVYVWCLQQPPQHALPMLASTVSTVCVTQDFILLTQMFVGFVRQGPTGMEASAIMTLAGDVTKVMCGQELLV